MNVCVCVCVGGGVCLRWNNTPGKVTQINTKLFDYERSNDKLTVHMSNKRKFCSLEIKTDNLKIQFSK